MQVCCSKYKFQIWISSNLWWPNTIMNWEPRAYLQFFEKPFLIFHSRSDKYILPHTGTVLMKYQHCVVVKSEPTFVHIWHHIIFFRKKYCRKFGYLNRVSSVSLLRPPRQRRAFWADALPWHGLSRCHPWKLPRIHL